MKTCEYCGSANRLERERCFSCNAPFSVKTVKHLSLLTGSATPSQKKVIENFAQRGTCYKQEIEVEMLSKKIDEIEALDKITASIIIDKLFNMMRVNNL